MKLEGDLIYPFQQEKVSAKKYPTDNLLYHTLNAPFWVEAKQAISMFVSLNANELLPPPPFKKRCRAFTAYTLDFHATTKQEKNHLIVLYIIKAQL